MAKDNPWVGPASFTSKDKERFFGRDDEARELGYLLLSRRAVLLYAQSGAGKTSLLQAKVIPGFEASRKLRVLPLTRVSGPVAAENPYVANTLAGLGLTGCSLPTALDVLLGPEPEFSERDAPPPVLLVIDQFEEVFTFRPDLIRARSEFFEQLRTCLALHSSLRLLLAMREDYLADMDSFAGYLPDRLRTRMRMERLTARQALEAISKPAENAGRPFAPNVASSLVDNLRRVQKPPRSGEKSGEASGEKAEADHYLGPYVEPVHLQIVCRQLWAKLPDDPPRGEREISSSHLEKLAGVDAALTEFYRGSLVAVLALREQAATGEGAALEPVPVVTERQLRDWVGTHLITPAKTRDLVYRDQKDTAGLPNAAASVLAGKYIIRADTRPAGTFYELSHDRLVEPILADNLAWAATYQNPVALAFRRNPDQLMDGSALKDALLFAREHPYELTGPEKAFLLESRRAKSRRNWLRGAAALVMLGLAVLLGIARWESLQARSMAFSAQAEGFLADADRARAMAKGMDMEAMRYLSKQNAHSLVTRAMSLKLDTRDGKVSGAVFSPDARRIVTTGEFGAAIVWDAFTGEKLYTLESSADSENLKGAVFSPDSKRIVTASEDGTAKVWDAASWKRLATLRPDEDPVAVVRVEFSPDNKRIVAVRSDNTATLWDAVTYRRITKMEAHTGDINSAVFSPDSKLFVFAGDDNQAVVWDAATGTKSMILPGPVDATRKGPSGMLMAAFSPDSRLIVTAGLDGKAVVWDAFSGHRKQILSGHRGAVITAAFSPDGMRIVTASFDKTARLWDVATGKSAELKGHTDRVYSAAFSPDGKRVVTAGADKTARLWEVATARSMVELKGHSARVVSAAFSPDGTRIVTASDDETVRVWNLLGWASVSEPVVHGEPVFSAAFSPDGKLIVTASADKTAKVWDAATGTERSTLSGHTDEVNRAAFSPDGKLVVTASADHTARLWDLASGQSIWELKGHEGKVNSAAFSPRGEFVVTASEDKTAKVWDVLSGAERWTLSGHQHGINSAVFSPNGEFIVTASDDDTAQVWDVKKRTLVTTLKGHQNFVTSAAFSPDGKRIVTGSADRTACIWDAATGKQPLFCLTGHTLPVSSVSYSPDGKLILTAGYDRTTRTWNATSGELLSSLAGHKAMVLSAAFSPDGQRVVTAGWDGTARIQRVVTMEEISRLLRKSK